MTKRLPIALAGLVLAAAALPAVACLWDDDTIAMESGGLPEVQQVIAGSFVRNPPLYYEMRLDRVTRVLKESPDDLRALDNAGVACDRLGRGDDAVAWMAHKHEALGRLEAAAGEEVPQHVRDHRYRYHANLGTFLAHRWLRTGGDRTRIEEMETAAAHIRKAIELNPDAHFGRERYQLAAMEWIVKGERWEPGEKRPSPLGDFLDLTTKGRMGDLRSNDVLETLGYGDAVQGLCGLIVLGNAWESVDVFHTLSLALQVDGRSTLSYLAELRARELIAAGRRSLRPGYPEGEALAKAVTRMHFLRKERQEELREVFAAARKKSRKWHAQRTDFMLERLRAGRHPDTDPEFWDGFEG